MCYFLFLFSFDKVGSRLMLSVASCQKLAQRYYFFLNGANFNWVLCLGCRLIALVGFGCF